MISAIKKIAGFVPLFGVFAICLYGNRYGNTFRSLFEKLLSR